MNARRLALPLFALASANAAACGESLAGARTTVERGDYTIVYVTVPHPVPTDRHFVVEFAACARGTAPAPQSVRIDASMPEHRHGMNYRPTVTAIGPGRYRAEGLLFHMPGRWELTFDVITGTTTTRLASALRVD
jgi:hypothetical protein